MRTLPIAVILTVMSFASEVSAQTDGRKTGCDFPKLNAAWVMVDATQRRYPERVQALAIKADVPVYAEESGTEPLPEKLPFNARVYIVEPGTTGGARFKVIRTGGQPLGWVGRNDMLCRLDPLVDAQSKLLRRMVVRTETSEQDEGEDEEAVVARTAWHSPTADVCQGGGAELCKKASRFQWYFIYHEEAREVVEQDGQRRMKRRFLLSEQAKLGNPDDLFFGWLPEEHGIAWNTAVGLRPSEVPQERQGQIDAQGTVGSGKFVCAWQSQQDIGIAEKCRPIVGGKDWYKSDVRIALLAERGDTYEVAVSAAAVTRGYTDTVQSLSELKTVDVFFVIDGTRSMQRVIDFIKGTTQGGEGFIGGGQPQDGFVKLVREKLKEKLSEGGKLRLGFRIYRDSAEGGEDGIENSPALSLSGGDKCGGNEEEFIRAFQDIKAEDTQADDDFAENSLGALDKMNLDITSCPGHLKVIFLIGDHGYDADKQSSRGFAAVAIEDVARKLRKGANGLKVQPIVSVIQIATQREGVDNKVDYDRAYNLFKTQGLALLAAVYANVKLHDTKPEDFFHRLVSTEDQAVMLARVLKPIDDLLNPRAIAEIMSDVQSGASVEEAIARARKGDRKSIPMLWFDLVAPELCQRLGDQCRERVFEGVFTAFVPKSPDIETDILLSDRQHADWKDLLSTVVDNWFPPSQRSREEIVMTMLETIGSRVRISIDDSGLNLQQFLGMKGGIPFAALSPLMAYTPEELRNIALVPACEVDHILAYAKKKLRILQITDSGDQTITFPEQGLKPEDCLGATVKGQSLKLPGDYRVVPLNAPGQRMYSYKFRKGNATFYWLKNTYLP